MKLTPKRVAAASAVVLVATFALAPRRRGRRSSTSGSGSHELNRFGVAFARAGSSPAWPLQGTSNRAVSTDFGDGRPWNAKHPSRHHAGEDLKAPEGTVLVATEPGQVVLVDSNWYDRELDDGTVLVAGALMLQLDSGVVVNYGEIKPGSPSDFGIYKGVRVAKGQPIARVGFTDMVHFETYRQGTKRTYQWAWGGAPPPALLDPTKYLQAAGGVVS